MPAGKKQVLSNAFLRAHGKGLLSALPAAAAACFPQHHIPHLPPQIEPQEGPQKQERSENSGRELLEMSNWKAVTSVLDSLCPVL